MADETVADVAIQQVVLAELGWGPEVQVAEIGLTVEKGGMTLAGTARSLADRRKKSGRDGLASA